MRRCIICMKQQTPAVKNHEDYEKNIIEYQNSIFENIGYLSKQRKSQIQPKIVKKSKHWVELIKSNARVNSNKCEITPYGKLRIFYLYAIPQKYKRCRNACVQKIPKAKSEFTHPISYRFGEMGIKIMGNIATKQNFRYLTLDQI